MRTNLHTAMLMLQILKGQRPNVLFSLSRWNSQKKDDMIKKNQKYENQLCGYFFVLGIVFIGIGYSSLHSHNGLVGLSLVGLFPLVAAMNIYNNIKKDDDNL